MAITALPEGSQAAHWHRSVLAIHLTGAKVGRARAQSRVPERASQSDGAAGAALDGDFDRLKTGAPVRMAIPAQARSAGVTAAR